MYAQDHKGIGKEGNTSFVGSAYGNGGAHRMGARVFFSFVADAAEKVFLVGSFNDWSESIPMQCEDGLWQTGVRADEISDGDLYKFKIYTQGAVIYVSDPYSPETDGEPYFNSIYRESPHQKSPVSSSECHDIPMSIYAVKADAWAYGSDGNPLPYEMLSNELLPYLLQMGYTHVAVSNIFEADLSSPKREQGGTEGLRKLVCKMHSCRIGVLICADETNESAQNVAQRLAYWHDTLAADGILIDLPHKRELEFYYELCSSVKRINHDVQIISNISDGISTPSDIAVRECAEYMEGEPHLLRDVAADATEILLREGKMLTRAGCELGLSDRSAAVDWKRTDCADCARLQLYLSELNRVYLSNPMIRCNESGTHPTVTEKDGIRITKIENDQSYLLVMRNLCDSDVEIPLTRGADCGILISTGAEITDNTVKLAGGAVCVIADEKKSD